MERIVRQHETLRKKEITRGPATTGFGKEQHETRAVGSGRDEAESEKTEELKVHERHE